MRPSSSGSPVSGCKRGRDSEHIEGLIDEVSRLSKRGSPAAAQLRTALSASSSGSDQQADDDVNWGVQAHIGGREYMEDRCLAGLKLGHSTLLHAVFDGHGGTTVSNFLAQHAAEYISQAREEHPQSHEAALKAAFLALDAGLPTVGESGAALMEGSTAVAVLLEPDEIVCANCGERYNLASLGEYSGPNRLSHSQSPLPSSQVTLEPCCAATGRRSR
jgi:hypothetical protein